MTDLTYEERSFMTSVDVLMKDAAEVYKYRGVNVVLNTYVNELSTDDEILARWLQKIFDNKTAMEQFNETYVGHCYIFSHISLVIDEMCSAMRNEDDNYQKLVQAKKNEFMVAVVGGKVSGYLQRMRENMEDASAKTAQLWPAIFSLTAIAARLVEK